jgi:hypothetical protein
LVNGGSDAYAARSLPCPLKMIGDASAGSVVDVYAIDGALDGAAVSSWSSPVHAATSEEASSVQHATRRTDVWFIRGSLVRRGIRS